MQELLLARYPQVSAGLDEAGLASLFVRVCTSATRDRGTDQQCDSAFNLLGTCNSDVLKRLPCFGQGTQELAALVHLTG